MMTDHFQTIANSAQAELREKASRFIAHAEPISSREQADLVLAKLRKKYHDATHHCYAFCLGVESEEIIRVHDDGEPAGTAGKPILQVIRGHGLTNLIVVVTRYFGGTKLGTGGLVRAYGDVTTLVLAQCRPVKRFIEKTWRIHCGYEHSALVMKWIEKSGARIVASSYDTAVILDIAIRKSSGDELMKQLRDHSAGKIQMIELAP